MWIGVRLYLKRIIVILKNGISALRRSRILYKRCRATIRINLPMLIKIGMEPHTCFIRGYLIFATLLDNIADKTRTLRRRLRINQRTILFHHNLPGDCSGNCGCLSMCPRLCRRRVGHSLHIKRNIYMRTIAKCHNNGRLLRNSRAASRLRTRLPLTNNQFICDIRRHRTRMLDKFFSNKRLTSTLDRLRPIKTCWRKNLIARKYLLITVLLTLIFERDVQRDIGRITRLIYRANSTRIRARLRILAKGTAHS